MLDEPTYERLISMRLRGLADAWKAQQQDPQLISLTFDERLGLLVDAEWTYRERKKVERNLKQAKLRLGQACIKKLARSHGLAKKTVLELATCKWIELHQNIVITGMTGVGKTFVACALAQQACRRGYRVLYRRVSRLFHELALAHADGSYTRLLARLAKTDVLVLDDWASRTSGPASVGISTRSWTTGMVCGPRSSPANCQRRNGTTIWAIPLPPTPSAIVSSATHTGSSSPAHHVARKKATSTSNQPQPSVASLRSRSRPEVITMSGTGSYSLSDVGAGEPVRAARAGRARDRLGHQC